MTSEQAIHILRNMAFLSGKEDAEKTEEAIGMAIKALSCSEKPNNSDFILRQDAIDAIKPEEKEEYDYWTEHDDEGAFCAMNAFSRSIAIIKKLPSAQPELTKNSPKLDNNIGDLISRKAAIDAIINLTNTGSVEELREYVNRHGLTKMWSDGVLESIDAVACLPPAQPEIIRCNDCKWWRSYYDEKYNVGYELCSNPKMMSEDSMIDMSKGDFFSKAERKDNG